MSPFNLAEYEPVEDRLRAFWEEYPTGRIATALEHVGADGYIVRAEVYRWAEDDRATATGYAQEAVTERGVNSTSALENCETSAIGRALANMGYAAKGKRPSREEMSKASGASPSSASLPNQRSSQQTAAPEDVPPSGPVQGEGAANPPGGTTGEGGQAPSPTTDDSLPATDDDLAAAAKHGLTPSKAKALAKGLGFEWPPTRDQLVAVIERYLEVKK